MRVLLVDDDSNIATILRLAFLSQGISDFIWQPDLSEAKGLIEQNRYDIVLLDERMPEENGLDWWQKLSPSPEIPFVLLSAERRPEVKQKAYDLGCSMIVEKPFDPLALAKEIISLYNSKAAI